VAHIVCCASSHPWSDLPGATSAAEARSVVGLSRRWASVEGPFNVTHSRSRYSLVTFSWADSLTLHFPFVWPMRLGGM